MERGVSVKAWIAERTGNGVSVTERWNGKKERKKEGMI